MLYETAARAAEVLALDVEDLDKLNRCSRVRREGGPQNAIVLADGDRAPAGVLPQGRTSGPLFVTDLRTRVELPQMI